MWKRIVAVIGKRCHGAREEDEAVEDGVTESSVADDFALILKDLCLSFSLPLPLSLSLSLSLSSRVPVSLSFSVSLSSHAGLFLGFKDSVCAVSYTHLTLPTTAEV